MDTPTESAALNAPAQGAQYPPPTRPRVTLAYAQTLDGRLATRTGSSQWISGPDSLRFAHEQRAAHAAIMVGAGTVCQDNPRLTVRLVEGRDPLRVIVDSTLRLPLTSAVVSEPLAAGTLLATTERAPAERVAEVRARGATVLVLPAMAGGQVDLAALLGALAARGVGSCLVEGGARLITAFLRARLANAVALTIAPKVLGTGIEAVGDLGISDLANALTLTDVRLTHAGVDVLLEANIAYPEPVAANERERRPTHA